MAETPDSVSSTLTPDFANMLDEDRNLDAYLENIDPDPADFIPMYNAECIQKTGNFASSDPRYSFESGPEHRPLTREILASISPKCLRMIEEIEKQDEDDLRIYGRRFKHFVYSGVKSTTKLLATALMDILGIRLGYDSAYLAPADEKDKKWGKIQLREVDDLYQTRYNNLYLLNSVDVFGQPLGVAMRKELLTRFNMRPENSHGELVRFIVMDSGFKEGIDLFDIKYVHIFEPQMTMADQKQVIGRGTRTCGQKGLDFHPTRGWPLFVNIYDSEIPEEVRFGFDNAATVYDLYMKALGLDVRLLNLTADMERMYIEGAIDNELNEAVHSFELPITEGEGIAGGGEGIAGGNKYDAEFQHILKQMPLDRLVDVLVNEENQIRLPATHDEMRQYVRDNYMADYKWPEVVMENKCMGGSAKTGVGAAKAGGKAYAGVGAAKAGGSPTLQFTPTQDFIRMFMTPQLDRKGLMLIHSTGSGKTCTAIATATSSFEEQGYTILWVTRTTLKSDIWKNMFDQVCSESIRTMIRLGAAVPADQKGRMKLLSKAWSIRPMSYKQFSNMVSGKNSIYKDLVKRNGAADPLRKTLVIIDEAHKLYGDGGLSPLEKPDMTAFYDSVMRSYEVSGTDSVRLLIMTATPITTSPMEFVKLLNLCRERQDRIEDAFETFAQLYLDDTGMFSAQGRDRFLNEMAGYVSYLNREKDARTFAQPIIKHVVTPILQSPMYRAFDPRITRVLMKTDAALLKAELDAAIEARDALYENIKAESFGTIKLVCNQFAEKRVETACLKYANTAIRSIMGFLNEKRAKSKDVVKGVREKITEFNRMRRKVLRNMYIQIRQHKGAQAGALEPDAQNGGRIVNGGHTVNGGRTPNQLPDFGDDFHKYEQSSFNAIKTKCKDPAKRAVFDNYPEVVRLREETDVMTLELKARDAGIKTMRTNLRKGEQEVRKTMKAEKDGVRKALFKEMLEQRVGENKLKMNEAKLETAEVRGVIQDRIARNERHTRKLKYALERAYKKSLKNRASNNDSDVESLSDLSTELEKSILIFNNATEIEDAELREFVQNRAEKFADDLREYQRGLSEEQAAKEQAAIDKEMKRVYRDIEKAYAKEAKAEAKTQKAVAKAEAKAEVKALLKAARKTQKNVKK
jgi:hypothetical protein